MSDEYLWKILEREAVDTSATSPVLAAANALLPTIRKWGNHYLGAVSPSGSWAKGTANRSGTDIDLFLSVSDSAPNPLKEIYDTLFNAMKEAGYAAPSSRVSP